MSTVLDPVERPAPIIESPVELISDWEEKYRRRVADAASALDEHKPGWHRKVSTETLNMASIENCVLGQVFGVRLFRSWRESGFGRGISFLASVGLEHYGSCFCAPMDQPAWINEIERRQAS